VLSFTLCASVDADPSEAPRPSAGSSRPTPRFSFWAASTQAQSVAASRPLRKRLKFFFRALRQPRLTRAWLARLVQPDLAPLWELRPRLALKLQRPYLCCAWGPLERLASLLGHYEILPELFSASARAAIFREGLDLIRLALPGSGRLLTVRLFYHDRFEKEGELTLAIREEKTGLMMAGLTFSLVNNAGARIGLIGGLQAANDPRMRDLIHDVAKEMHGLRPKALALWCFQQLSEPWQLTEIQAVGDAQHVWRHWSRRREIAACYDEFWRESDGQLLPGGGCWKLPLRPRPRSREELKPSRRRQHELRYAMLDRWAAGLLTASQAVAPRRQNPAPTAAGHVGFAWGTEPRQAQTASRLAALNHSF